MSKYDWETTDSIINRIFDPRKQYGKCHIDKHVKINYLKEYLEKNWEAICGANLAKSCRVDKIDGGSLYVKVANSPLASELKMMENTFLKKINHYLEKKVIIKKIYFSVGRIIDNKKTPFAAENQEGGNFKKSVCTLCGSSTYADGGICSLCELRIRREESRRIRELLLAEPWLSYKECNEYKACKRTVFSAVKDSLKQRFFLSVKNKEADTSELLTAVMLLLEKKPEEIDNSQFANALEYLRRG